MYWPRGWKLSCHNGPKKLNNLVYKNPTKENILTILPDERNIVESYNFDYTQIIPYGKTRYVRLNICYSNLNSVSGIQSVLILFRN